MIRASLHAGLSNSDCCTPDEDIRKFSDETTIFVIKNSYRSVPQIRPPFATLALVQSAGGAYTRDAAFSLMIMPPLNREMLSGSVDADFVLALPSTTETLNLTV